MKTILSVKIHPMCELVLSLVTLKFKEDKCDSYCQLEEYGTIEDLCVKYLIIRRGHDNFDSDHLVGKKCSIGIKDGKTIFEHYCL